MFFSLLSVPYPPIQFAQTNVTMCNERAHAEFFSEGESLTIVVLGLLDIRDSDLASCDLAEKPQRPRLVTSFLVT